MKKAYSKIFGIQKNSAGFTLVELLVAASITTIVVAAAGFGLVTIAKANQKGRTETERRVTLNRAQDFISDEVRTAIEVKDSSSVPTWNWNTNLGGGSPSAKLYLRIPLKASSVDASNDKITINNHGFSAGNAVRFTGSSADLAAANLTANTTYYVTKETTPDSNTFRVSDSLSNANAGTAVNLNAVTPGSLTANRLLTYYIRENTSTWLGPRTINRSAGDCTTPYQESNCPALVDSIAANGFTATATSSRKADLTLIGQLYDNSTAETLTTSNDAFARPSEIALGGSTSSGSTSSGSTSSGSTSSGSTSSGSTSSGSTSSGSTSSGSTSSGSTSSGSTSSGSTSSGSTSSGSTSSGSTSSGSTSSGSSGDGNGNGNGSSGSSGNGNGSSGGSSSGGSTSSGSTSSGSSGNGYSSSSSSSSGNVGTSSSSSSSGDVGTSSSSSSTSSGGSSSGGSSSGSSGSSPPSQPFTTNGGTVTFTQAVDAQFKILGGNVTCGAGGAEFLTEATMNINPPTGGSFKQMLYYNPASAQLPGANLIAPAGSSVDVTGSIRLALNDTNTCNLSNDITYNSATNAVTNSPSDPTQQVWTLKNGDTPPRFTPFGEQKPIDQFLTEYLNPTTGRVTLQPNQVIYLFEFQRYVQPPGSNGNPYDMQDLVVLATINSPPQTIPVPSAPVITATVVPNTTKVKVRWNAVSYSTGYDFYTCEVNRNQSCILALSSQNTDSPIENNVNTLSNNWKRCFAVKAKNSSGSSNLSNILCFNRTAGTENP